MSIIYDALKKTQNQRESEQKPLFLPEKKRALPKWLLYAVLLSGFLIAMIVLFHHINFAKLFKPAKKIPPPVVVQVKKHEPLILNGVFLSRDKRVAMINQHLYSLGDTVFDMKIVEINESNIKLKAGNTEEVLTILGV